MQQKFENILIFQIIGFELVVVNPPYYNEYSKLAVNVLIRNYCLIALPHIWPDLMGALASSCQIYWNIDANML